MTEPLLEVKGLSRRFGGLLAVDNLNLSVYPGEIVSLIGPNGAGKTTAFNVITGIYPPTSGAILYQGEPIHNLAPHHVCARGIARTFQNLRIFPNLTVLENVMVGLNRTVRSGIVETILRTPRQQSEERQLEREADELIRLLGIEDTRDYLARYLPYGDQRRVEIARALATQPTLLMLDEPAAGMNHVEIEDLNRLIRRLRDELGKTILLVEHHMNVVMDISDRVAVLNYGRKIAEGTPAEVRSDQQVIEAYLGTETVV